MEVELPEYSGLTGVEAIVFLDPDAERVRLVERTGAEAWTDTWLPKGSELPLRALGISLAHVELFALD